MTGSEGTNTGTADLLSFVRRLSPLLSAGVGLSRAVRMLADDRADQGVARASRQLGEMLESGRSLSRSLGSSKELGDPLLMAVVKAGERTGRLAESIERLAGHLETQERRHARLRGAAWKYGAGLFFGALLLGTFFLFVMPDLRMVYRSMNIELPAATRFLIFASDFLTGHMCLAGLIALSITWWMSRLLRRRRSWDLTEPLVNRLPLVGSFVGSGHTVWLYEGLSLLLGSGVSATEALATLATSAGSSRLGRGLSIARLGILNGEALSGGLLRGRVIDPASATLISTGEEIGRTEEMCELLARTHAKSYDGSLVILGKIAQPAIVVGLGLVVGAIALAAFSPFTRLCN